MLSKMGNVDFDTSKLCITGHPQVGNCHCKTGPSRERQVTPRRSFAQS